MVKSGEEHPNSKLTEEKVRFIRENPENLNDHALGRKIGVERSTVRLVRLNAIWRDEDYTPRESTQGRGRPRKDGKPPRPKETADE